MKRILFLIVWIALISGFSLSVFAKDKELPNYSGYLNDYVGLISPAQQEEINRLAKELESKTTAQIAVVTIDTTAPETIEQYAVRLFKKWGIGQQGKDNGVLFLIANSDRTMRIEVGYGLEGVLTDAISSRIINEMIVPKFKAGQISAGIYDGTSAIVSLIAKEYGAVVTGQEAAIYENLHEDPVVVWAIIFIFILIFVFFIFSFKRGGVGWYNYGSSGGGFGGGSGGFGGFGGGGSGGGGASGRW